MYDMDVLKPGEIGGHCKLTGDTLSSHVTRLSSLQTWLPELRNFAELNESIMLNPDSHCDQIISTPVYIMKIDASKLPNFALLCCMFITLFHK